MTPASSAVRTSSGAPSSGRPRPRRPGRRRGAGPRRRTRRSAPGRRSRCCRTRRRGASPGAFTRAASARSIGTVSTTNGSRSRRSTTWVIPPRASRSASAGAALAGRDPPLDGVEVARRRPGHQRDLAAGHPRRAGHALHRLVDASSPSPADAKPVPGSTIARLPGCSSRYRRGLLPRLGDRAGSPASASCRHQRRGSGHDHRDQDHGGHRATCVGAGRESPAGPETPTACATPRASGSRTMGSTLWTLRSGASRPSSRSRTGPSTREPDRGAVPGGEARAARPGPRPAEDRERHLAVGQADEPERGHDAGRRGPASGAVAQLVRRRPPGLVADGEVARASAPCRARCWTSPVEKVVASEVSMKSRNGGL